MLMTVAKDAKVRVEWNPSVVARYRLLGYENRDVRDEDFREDDVDGGEIGAGHAVSALYELKLHANGPPGPLGTFRIRYADPATPGRVVEESVPIEREVLSGEPSRTLLLCAAAAEFAEILRESYWARDGSLRAVADLVSGILDRWGRREEVVELLDLVNRAAALMEGTAGTPPEERPVLEGR
jgi:Ca-activated chloride channel family protein